MSNPTGNPLVSFRADDAWRAPVRERQEDGEPEGSVIRRDLARYYEVLRQELARGLPFSAQEMALICDALNGYSIAYLSDYDVHLRAWWINVEDAIQLNGLAEKWEVAEPATLVARCRNLSPGATAALLDAVARWWARPTVEGETIEDSLRAVGLIR